MFPRHTKSIFVMIRILHNGIFIVSIAHFVSCVESHFGVRSRFDTAQQFCFGPAKLLYSLDVPCPILKRQFCFHDNHILCPTDLHSLLQNLRSGFIRTVKRPHPPQVPGGETRCFGITFCQIVCCYNSGTFFFSGADQPPDLAV